MAIPATNVTHTGCRWARLAPKKAFIPWGSANAFDSHAIYAAGPFPDPDPAQKDRRLRIYYRASDGPHGNGRSTMGLAYSLPIPAGVTGVGELRTSELSLDSSDDRRLVLHLVADDEALPAAAADAAADATAGAAAGAVVGVRLLDAATGELLRSGVAQVVDRAPAPAGSGTTRLADRYTRSPRASVGGTARQEPRLSMGRHNSVQSMYLGERARGNLRHATLTTRWLFASGPRTRSQETTGTLLQCQR